VRIVVCLCAVLLFGPVLFSQAPSSKLSIGTPKSSVDAAFGKRFGPFKVEANDENASIGVVAGSWDVYHMTAPPDRMYVTIVHFGTDQLVDSLMLMPAGKTSVAQIMADQPAFASVCKADCELVLVTNKAGNRSLLLRPKDSHTQNVLYFDGDSATLKWASVTSMDSVVSWAYALSKSAFESHHQSGDDRVIGHWSSELAAGK
jgi:hypothetical protein